MESEYVLKVGERVYVQGQSGEFEVLDPDDDGQVLVKLIGTHGIPPYQRRFRRPFRSGPYGTFEAR
jgi:hypothetical protein